MPWYSYLAIFFVIWWLALFAVLPFGIRSQTDDEIMPGTERGAPARFGIGRKMLATTALALLVFAIYYTLTVVLGYSIDDIPSFIPAYD